MRNISELTIEEYKKLNIIEDEEDLIKFVYNYDTEYLDSIDVDVYNSLINEIKDYKNYITRKFEYIQLGDYRFYYKNYKKLTLGEYLDIHNYIKSNEIHKVYSIMYRLSIKEQTIFDSRVLEDYIFDIEHRQNVFNNVSIKYYFQILDDLYEMSELIKKNYKLIFDEKEKNVDISKLEGAAQQQYLHNKKIKESYDKNAWEYIVYHLSNEDITKFDEIYNKNIFTIFNTLLLRRKLELHNK